MKGKRKSKVKERQAKMIDLLETKYKTVKTIKFIPGDGYRIYALVTPPGYADIASEKQLKAIKNSTTIISKYVTHITTLTRAQAWAIVGAGIMLADQPYEFFLVIKQVPEFPEDEPEKNPEKEQYNEPGNDEPCNEIYNDSPNTL